MNIRNLSFEEVLQKYEPIIKKQMMDLGIYKNFDEFYQLGKIALWNAYENFDPEKGNFATYAISMIRGNLQTQLSKETKYTNIHSNATEELFHYIGYEPTYEALEIENLKSYLHGLSNREMIWVYEHVIMQKKLTEIAKEYKVSVNTVKTWRKNAIKKLRDQFYRENGK